MIMSVDKNRLEMISYSKLNLRNHFTYDGLYVEEHWSWFCELQLAIYLLCIKFYIYLNGGNTHGVNTYKNHQST